jgi:hypothetical protein
MGASRPAYAHHLQEKMLWTCYFFNASHIYTEDIEIDSIPTANA